MSTTHTNIEPDSLFWKFFANEATEVEKLQLLSWVKQTDENKRQFQAARLAYISAKHPVDASSFDGAKAFDTFIEKTSKTKTFALWKTLAAAACAVVIFGAGIFFFSHETTSQSNNLLAFSSTRHQTKSLTLPDGSTVKLNRNSAITYDSSSISSRVATLRGEAFFDVHHDAAKPFAINVGELTIKVLGTSFVVDAHTSSNTVNVKVLSGRVMLSNGKSSVILSENQAGIYHKETRQITSVNTFDKNDIAWKTNELSFSSTPLSVVAQKLGKYFDTTITVTDPKVANYQLSVSLDNPNLDSVLKLLQLTFNIDVARNDSTIVLKDNTINN